MKSSTELLTLAQQRAAQRGVAGDSSAQRTSAQRGVNGALPRVAGGHSSPTNPHSGTSGGGSSYIPQVRGEYTVILYIVANKRLLDLVIPAKAKDYVFTGVGLSVCLSVCLFVTTITK